MEKAIKSELLALHLREMLGKLRGGIDARIEMCPVFAVSVAVNATVER